MKLFKMAHESKRFPLMHSPRHRGGIHGEIWVAPSKGGTYTVRFKYDYSGDVVFQMLSAHPTEAAALAAGAEVAKQRGSAFMGAAA